MMEYRRGYKTKTIKQVLRKKTDAWLASIEDIELRTSIKNKIIITGGCIASMLLGEKVNDFDVYFRDMETAFAVAKYYVARFETKTKAGIPCKIWADNEGARVRVIIKSSGIVSEDGTEIPYEYFETHDLNKENERAAGYVAEVMQDPGDIQDAYDETEQMALDTEDAVTDNDTQKYRPVFMSTNAITLSGRIQLILRFYGEPDTIHENYDFAHCTNYWTSWDRDGKTLTLRQPALESLLARELRYVGSKYPICSLIRIRKFVARGWTINAGQILKAVMQVSELDLKDVKVLEDQLTGVDVAYFLEVIAKLKEKDPEKVNSAYLIEIIDRMF